MRRASLLVITCAVLAAGQLASAEVVGSYIEARTCQVYTGPCFANGEVGLAGKEAVMAWNIEKGQHQGVDLAGLNVIMILRSAHTLGFYGIDEAQPQKAVVLVDEAASTQQRAALLDFAKTHSGKAGEKVVRVDAVPMKISLDKAELNGSVEAGKAVKLSTRKARKGDCICSNESAYYPPLAKVENFAPGVTMEGKVVARGLGSRWEVPDNRNAYMATFAY